MLPKGWDILHIGDIAKVTSGGTPSREEPSFWNGDIPWIRTTEVQNCRVNLEDVKEFITAKGLKNSSTKTVPKDTILLAMIGQGKTRGQVAILTFEATINQNCAAIILNNNQSPEYYFYYLLGQYENIRKSSNSAGQSNLSGSLVKSIKVLVPPLPEQIKIAEILSTWDNAINTVQKLLTNSQQQKKALMQQLLTGEKRFSGFEGEWEEKRLDNVSQIAKGKAISSKDVVSGCYPVIAGGKTSPYSHNDFTHEKVITVSASGAYAGHIWYHQNRIWASDCSVIQSKKNSDIIFLNYWLKEKQSLIYSLQSGGAQPHIYPKDLGVLKIYTPSLPEQQKIAAVLTTADQEIDNLRAQLNHLKQEKKALMQQLLTGKRRVKVEEAA